MPETVWIIKLPGATVLSGIRIGIFQLQGLRFVHEKIETHKKVNHVPKDTQLIDKE